MTTTTSLNSVADCVYVINLGARTERMEAVRKRFGRHGIAFERHNAVDGHSDAVKAEFEREKTRLGERQHWGWKHSCHYACLRSHEEVWRAALARGCKHIAVFEDDVLLRNDFGSCFDALAKCLPEDWGVLYLGAYVKLTRLKQSLGVPQNKTLLQHRRHLFGGYGYLLSANAMRALVRKIDREGYVDSLDAWLLPSVYAVGESGEQQRCFLSGTPLCITDVQTSDLRRSRSLQSIAMRLGWQLHQYA